MATLTVTASHNYTGEPVTDIDSILYSNAVAAIATFASTQFGPGLISNSVAITGNGAANGILVNLSAAGSFSAANWTFSAWSGSDTITFNGTSGADSITGSSQADTFFAGDGADTLTGGDGNDVLVAHRVENLFAQDADSLSGGNGNDTLYGEAADTLNGGAGFDVLQIINAFDMNLNLAATGIEYVVSDFGNDFFDASGTTSTIEIYGSGGTDTMFGGSGNDVFWAGIGNDALEGGAGDDVLVGDLGLDNLFGGSGSDRIYADADDSFVNGGGGGFDALYIIGGTGMTVDMFAQDFDWVTDFVNGDDTIEAGSTTTGFEAYAGGGSDLVNGGTGNDLIFGGAGGDQLIGFDGDDALIGEAGADTLVGQEGNDRLYIDSSDPFFDGGNGFDIVYIVGGTGMTINMATSNLEYAQDLAGGNDVFDAFTTSLGVQVFAGGGIDTVYGGSGLDTLWAGAGDDEVHGNAGNDVIVGEGGADFLFGEAGNDSFYGGAGADKFVWTTGGGTDGVFDWEDGSDILQFMGEAGLDDFSDLTVVNNAGNAEIFFGASKLFVVIGAAGQIGAGDCMF